jgi:hypothetical protein
MTAEETIKVFKSGFDGILFNETQQSIVEYLMIEFAQYHVTEALKAAAEKAELDYDNGRCRECGSNKIDEKSILNSYPLTNIK